MTARYTHNVDRALVAAADRISAVIKARKRDINKFPRFAIARKGAFYSDDDITTIIDATGSDIPPGRRDELVRRLDQAANRWILDDQMQRSPTPRMLEKQFTEIERAAAHTLRAPSTDEPKLAYAART